MTAESDSKVRKEVTMRPRAGHGWTGFHRGGKFIHLICDCDGRWVTTGVAANWQRCSRCRKPEDQFPHGSDLCVHCYYYKSPERDGRWFWEHESDYLFPYSIGCRTMNGIWDRQPLSDPKVNWREYLKTQPQRTELR